jgi:hypothetical protein
MIYFSPHRPLVKQISVRTLDRKLVVEREWRRHAKEYDLPKAWIRKITTRYRRRGIIDHTLVSYKLVLNLDSMISVPLTAEEGTSVLLKQRVRAIMALRGLNEQEMIVLEERVVEMEKRKLENETPFDLTLCLTEMKKQHNN